MYETSDSRHNLIFGSSDYNGEFQGGFDDFISQKYHYTKEVFSCFWSIKYKSFRKTVLSLNIASESIYNGVEIDDYTLKPSFSKITPCPTFMFFSDNKMRTKLLDSLRNFEPNK